MKKISIKLFSSSLIPLVLMFSLTFNINQELKNRVNINNEVITELVSSNDYLSLNNPVLETNLEALNKARINLDSTLNLSTSKLDQAKTNLVKMQTQLEASLMAEAELKEKIEELQAEIMKRSAIIGGGGGGFIPQPSQPIQPAPPVVDPRIAELNQLTTELNNLKVQYDALVLNNQTLTTQNTTNQTSVDALESQLIDLNANLVTLEQEKTAIEGNKTALNQRLTGLTLVDLEIYEIVINVRIDELNQEILLLNNQLAALEASFEALADNQTLEDLIVEEELNETNLNNEKDALNSTISTNNTSITTKESTLQSRINVLTDLNTTVEFFSSSNDNTLSYNLVNQLSTNTIKATVRVEMINTQLMQITSVGSGVVFKREVKQVTTRPNRTSTVYDYYILTNYHVISSEVSAPNIHDIRLKRYDGSNFNAQLIAYRISNNYDLALLKVSSSTDNIFEVIPLAGTSVDPYAYETNELLISLGNPKLQINTITVGKLEAISQTINVQVGSTVYSFDSIRHSALINSGSSGGALLNDNFELVGLNFAGSVNNEPFPFLSVTGYAIKLEYIYQFLIDYLAINPSEFSLNN
jgi:S1-C subfamily serine protease